MRRVLFLVLACLCLSTASAQDRDAKIRALMEAQGLLTTLQQQFTMGRERAHAMGKQMMEQVLAGLVPDADTKAKVSQAASQFVDEMQNPMSAADIVGIWSDAYGSKFSDAELDGLLAYYQSPLAQKEVLVSRQALGTMTERVQAAYKPVMDAAVAHYVARLKTIVVDCHCAKK